MGDTLITMEGMNNSFLYSAYQINIVFGIDHGKPVERSATCFVVHHPPKLFLVTNRHVVDIEYSLQDSKYRGYTIREAKILGRNWSKDQPFVLRVKLTKDAWKFSGVFDNDVACMEIKNEHIVVESGPHNGFTFPIPYDMIASHEIFMESLKVTDQLAIPSFASFHDRGTQRPIMLTGSIASDPRRDYSIYSDRRMGDCVAYEAFSYGGASGSPVFTPQRGYPPEEGNFITYRNYRPALLVGVNAGHLTSAEFSHVRLSYFFKSYVIRDIIDSMS